MGLSFIRRRLNGCAVLCACALAGSAAADNCATLAELSLKDAKITAAEVVAAGAYVPAKPFFIPMPPPYAALPAFCRVAGRITPTPDSNIAFEVWLPVADWNGKLVAVGNGGYSGEIWFPFMAAPLGAGYVAASTDTGHEGSPVDASFAMVGVSPFAAAANRPVYVANSDALGATCACADAANSASRMNLSTARSGDNRQGRCAPARAPAARTKRWAAARARGRTAVP